ncbi:MAG TPA: hypothetical protein VN253_01010 [Kofleriaceae bacterium]|nr:hypothetical protein [Kofleriaceae bacterium]
MRSKPDAVWCAGRSRGLTYAAGARRELATEEELRDLCVSHRGCSEAIPVVRGRCTIVRFEHKRGPAGTSHAGSGGVPGDAVCVDG